MSTMWWSGNTETTNAGIRTLSESYSTTEKVGEKGAETGQFGRYDRFGVFSEKLERWWLHLGEVVRTVHDGIGRKGGHGVPVGVKETAECMIGEPPSP